MIIFCFIENLYTKNFISIEREKYIKSLRPNLVYIILFDLQIFLINIATIFFINSIIAIINFIIIFSIV